MPDDRAPLLGAERLLRLAEWLRKRRRTPDLKLLLLVLLLLPFIGYDLLSNRARSLDKYM